jgi:hypothetical protein
VAPVPDGLLAAIAGEYAQEFLILQLQPQPDGSLLVSLRSDAGWTPYGSPLKYRDDGWFASDLDPLKAFKVVDADLLGVPTQYILNRAPAGYGHYLDHSVFAQRVRRRPGNLSAAWRARLSSTWLVVNENPDELAWNGIDPRLRLVALALRWSIQTGTSLYGQEGHLPFYLLGSKQDERSEQRSRAVLNQALKQTLDYFESKGIQVVLLGEMQPDAASHQNGGDTKANREPVAQDQNRDGCAKERGDGEIRARPRRADVPERQHEQRQADAVTEKSNRADGQQQ